MMWNVIDTADGLLILETYPTLLECVEYIAQFIPVVQSHMSCVLSVLI